MKRFVITVGLMAGTGGLHLTMTLYALQFVPVEAQWAVLLWFGSLGAGVVLLLALAWQLVMLSVKLRDLHALRAENERLRSQLQAWMVNAARPRDVLVVRPRGMMARRDGGHG